MILGHEMILDHGDVGWDFRSEWTDRTYGSPEGDLYSPENNQPVFVLNHKSLQKLIDVYRQREAIVQSTKEPLPYESLVAGMDTGESGAGGVKYGRDIAAATVHKLLAALRVIQDYPDWYFSPDTTPHKIQANQTAYPTDVWDLSTKSLNIATLLWELRYTRLAPLGVRYRVWGVTGCAHYVNAESHAGYGAYNAILPVFYPPGPYPDPSILAENDPAFKAAIREHYNEAKARENTEIPANLYTLGMFGYTNSPSMPDYQYTQASVCYAYHIDSGPPSYERYAQYGTSTLNRAMAVRYVNITDQPQTFMLRLDFKLSGGYGSSPSIESNSTYPYSLAFGEISKADFDATGAGGNGSVYPSTPREPFSLAAFRTGADIRSVNRAFSNPEIVTRIIGPFTLAPKKTLHVAAQGIIGGSRNVTISNYYWGPQKYDAYLDAIVELNVRMWNQSNNYFSQYWIGLWNWATAQIPVAISAANEARAEAVAANQLGIVSVYDGILADLNSPWPQPTSKDQAVAAALRADNIANITSQIGWNRSNFWEGGAIRYDLPKISLDSGATWLAHANSILPVA